jgi:hypothetical protein
MPTPEDITLLRYERCHFAGFPPARHHGQAITAGWQSSHHRGEPAPEAAADYSQQIQAAGSQSHIPGSCATRLLDTVLESTPDSQICHHYQTADPAEISLCAKETKVPAAIFAMWWTQTRSKRPVDGPALCRMFKDATSRQGWPKYISSDNDPLFQYHRWKANLRVLDIEEIKSVPHAPMPHPFVERLIGSVRRELLDHTFFWAATDLENKLRDFHGYYNEHRTHSGQDGVTPMETTVSKVVDINKYRWEKHCRGLFEPPITA